MTGAERVVVLVRNPAVVIQGVLDTPWNGCDCHTPIVEIDGVNLADSLGDRAGARVRLILEVLGAEPA